MSTKTTESAAADERETAAAPPAEPAETAESTDTDESDEAAEPEAEAVAEPAGRKESPEAKGKSITIAIPMPGRASLGKLISLLVVVAALALGGWQWRHAADLEGREQAREEISSVAGRFGSALLSYEHGDLTAARERVLALATPDFGKTYETAFTQTLQSTILELQADATASVRVVYVSGGADGSAQAVVVMDSEVKSTAGTRNVTGSYLQMDLVELKGAWKVSAVNSIGAINESLADPSGAAPSAEASAEPSAEPSKTP
ncbi:hypothetical protein GCM10022221_27960 [Actinocorallia aurea]